MIKRIDKISTAIQEPFLSKHNNFNALEFTGTHTFAPRNKVCQNYNSGKEITI